MLHAWGLLAPEEVQADVQAMLGAQRVVFELPDAGVARVTLQDCVKVALGQSPRIPRPAGDELIITARPLGPPAAASRTEASHQGALSHTSSASANPSSKKTTHSIMSRVSRDGVELFWPRKRERLELQNHAPLVF